MRLAEVVFAASENNGAAKTHHHARLEINAVTVKGEICDQKFTFPNLGNNNVTNFLIVLFSIHTQRLVTTILNAQLQAVCPRAIEGAIE